jgi:hypothetical protein
MGSTTSPALRPTKEVQWAGRAIDPASLVQGGRPVILRGAADEWPLVAAGHRSIDAVARHLMGFDAGALLTRYVGMPDIHGRLFYNATMTGFNFTADRVSLAQHVGDMATEATSASPRALYVGSTDVDAYLPGFSAANVLDADFGAAQPTVSIWIGNRTVAATHYDASHNLACCAIGRRRFTLFPPDQVSNLYPGPLEPTPGGQVVSMVDPRRPDHDAFPHFSDALAVAEVAELRSGDVLFYPALWWHQVEALDPCNILVNYWWNEAPAWQDPPMGALLHALLSLRGRPAAERAAWRAMFDHYVFGEVSAATAHLPGHVHGALSPDERTARRLRAALTSRLNR